MNKDQTPVKKNKMNKLITFKTDKSGITIRIPKSLISFVAKRHPETPVQVTDSQELMESVAEQIESELLIGDECNSDTKFQTLIDEAIQESAINGRGCEFKEH